MKIEIKIGRDRGGKKRERERGGNEERMMEKGERGGEKRERGRWWFLTVLLGALW